MTKVYQASDIGKVRENNEDSLAIFPPEIYMVADGMGGRAGGEVASGLAVKTIQAQTAKRPLHEAELRQAVMAANEAILAMARSHQEYDGMGTTVTLLHLEAAMAYWAHVGDSRLYLFRAGALQQITRDHSLVADLVAKGSITREEARFHPQRNMITRAVGTEQDLSVDTGVFPLCDGDTLILCSDGLTSAVTDEEIRQVLAENRCDDKAAALVERALALDSQDNISVVVVCYGA